MLCEGLSKGYDKGQVAQSNSSSISEEQSIVGKVEKLLRGSFQLFHCRNKGFFLMVTVIKLFLDLTKGVKAGFMSVCVADMVTVCSKDAVDCSRTRRNCGCLFSLPVGEGMCMRRGCVFSFVLAMIK